MEIREIGTLEEIAEAHALVRRIWAAPAREEVSAEVFRAMTAHGNQLHGAFADGALVGISFGFWGRDPDGGVWLSSAKLGVAEEHRGAGAAEALKRAQAAWAAARSVDEIRWTFDPMRTRNARFNLHKLGATARTIIPDLHGPRDDAFNAGERTDRLLVVWRPAAGRRRSAAGNVRHVGVPRDFFDLPAADRAAHRDRVRDALAEAFDAGYVAVDFDDGAYVLAR